ncbi:BrnT family toxin [Lentisphaera marina]|uniref:BrnT family toxin n=1 Tax=Lentisphaera marina TaxID=1111041 RepID=UPI0023664B64|nr:BrnT family toxin [Lentisphaera marina]MDD7986756.1 BrnT family toxin [Lentisphaera marina]
MNKLKFEWDENKAQSNLEKHGVSFEEAMTVFYDERALEFFDKNNSEWEDRFLMLGLTTEFKLLLICHCYRDDDNIIRIISARKATKNEAKNYKR